ncbi:uncharacterized protein LOC116268292 [Nymphaea colorata]|uniref:uncharacterized protein LOC116268292 n=1 Tax=Nymphaea colorata TaxID=210225 RepID=UPI00129D420D|nr:uncharacterized protein LOC116268292 [Nymphaea colorata]
MHSREISPLGPVLFYLNSQSFTIHGLWPTVKTTKKYGAFDLSIIEANQTLYADMQNFWPPQSLPNHTPTNLWAHEWGKHGGDYAELLLRVRPDEFKGLSGDKLNKALQFAFFRDTIAFYKSFRATYRYPSSQLTKDSFAHLFGIQADQVTFSCVRGFTVREVKICFDLNKVGFTVKRCPKQENTGCKKGTNFELPGWR